ncbi:MAG: hypothetical protein NNA21_06305 [Nitrospira sp.]|nr:hypothetical protein [Nitrospira sp.]MCP9463111.1 hypothetical protein [Nitrospira sp.]MCP9475185.1 hypothetical protein [Nitrospira sp.]
MMKELFGGSSSYRVTLFFGPEPVDGATDVLACVFNVKKRSWKAGIQVSVEVMLGQVTRLRHELRLMDRLSEALPAIAPEERSACERRIEDLFVQAVAWCKLALGMEAGLTPESQCIPAAAFVSELDRLVMDRREDVAAYVASELDLAIDPSSPSPP